MTFGVLAVFSLCIFVVSTIALSVLRISRVWRRARISKRSLQSVADTDESATTDVKVHIVVYFGTQTGTSERFAREIEQDINHRYGKSVRVRTSDLEHVNAQNAEDEFARDHKPLAIFLQSTYGDGEPTDSSLQFVNWLRGQAEDGRLPDLLKPLTFSVFGLGNSSYEQFNAAAKLVDRCLHCLGAERLLKIHLGDDDNNLEEDFVSWKEELMFAIDRRYSLGPSTRGLLANVMPNYDVNIVSADVAKQFELQVENALSMRVGQVPTQHTPYAASVVHARELHSSNSNRSCVHIEFDISESGMTYQPGDHLGVFAENAYPVVQRAAACLRLPLDHSFALSIPNGAPASLSEPFPTPCTLRTALLKYTDLLSPPRKAALAALASISTDPAERKRLEFLSSSDGKREYAAFITDPSRSLIEVMEAFPSAVPPIGLFFAIIGTRLAPRYYSISSSPRHHSGIVSATVAVVSGKTPTGRLHEGVASSYLARFIPSGDDRRVSINLMMKNVRVPLFVRSSSFKLPRDPSVPIVMIGPGTGYAPFRGFIQERNAICDTGNNLGPAFLFFGCRCEDEDFIYRDEMELALKTKTITALEVAFSRANPDQKIYVQDRLVLSGKTLFRIIKGTLGASEGRIYVCGDAKGMARDVHRAIHIILMSEGGYAAHEAEDIVRRLSESGRYQKDVW